MEHNYKLFFSSPYNNLDSIKISGAMISALFKIYPDKSKEIEKEIAAGRFGVSDPLPFDMEEKSILFPVPPIPYIFPRNKNREERIKLAKERKKKISYSTICKIRDVLDIFLKEGISQDDATKILKPEENENSMDENKRSWNQDFTEYAVSLIDETPRVYVRELKVFGNMMFRDLNGKRVLSYDPVCIVAEFDKDYFGDSMNYLQDSGISAFLSRGKGWFRFEEFKSQEETGFRGEGYYLLLSEFLPEEKDLENIDLDKSYYTIGSFTGISSGKAALPKLRFFKSGSLLYLKDKLMGRNIFLKEQKRILTFHPIIIQLRGA
ncbi:type III-A CRISPR-associated RAMP protein Csm4 [Caldiplasma sukawensis]